MGLVTVGLWMAATVPLSAQEPDEEADGDGERCVCVDVDRIHDEVDRARGQVERALERVERMRVRMPPRARLGVTIDPEVEDGADAGVRVSGVEGSSPAAEAGIQEGDVLVGLDGHALSEPLPDPEDEDDLDDERPLPAQRLLALLERHEAGDEVEVAYLRDGERRSATVELASGRRMRMFRAPDVFRDGEPPRPPRPLGALGGEWEEDLERAIRESVRWSGAPARWREACRGLGASGAAFVPGGCIAGLHVVELNEELGEYFSADEGVLVLEVGEESTLELRAGDVILAVGERTVEEPADLRRILRSYEADEPVRFRVLRRDRELEVTGTAP